MCKAHNDMNLKNGIHIYVSYIFLKFLPALLHFIYDSFYLFLAKIRCREKFKKYIIDVIMIIAF